VTPPPRDSADGTPRIRPFLAAHQPAEAPPAEEALGFTRPRPFVITAGRVRAHDPDIDLHTQVTSRFPEPPGAGLALSHEQRAIVDLCVEAMSVAEISARLHLHLGVTKILVGDLRSAGYLDVHTQDVGSPHDAETILRVINGLRAFT
jgi:hypothetical protein